MVICQNCGNQTNGNFCRNCGMKMAYIQTQYEQQGQPPSYQQEQTSPYQQHIQFIPDQQPTSPKKQGPPKKVIITIIVITTIIVIAIISLAIYRALSTQDKPTTDFQDGHTFEMTSVDTMKMQFKYKTTGDYAKIERWSIDSTIGNNDGVVTSDEVREFEESYSEMVIGSQSNAVTIDNNEGVYTQFNASYDGAIGDIDSESPIFRTFSCTMVWTSIETNNISYSVKMSICAAESEKFSFISSPGYEISSVIGLDDMSYNDGMTNLAGTIYEGTPKWTPRYIAYITITKIGFKEPTPHSNLSFLEDPENVGRYHGTFQGTINSSEVEIIVIYLSLRIVIVLDLESETSTQNPWDEFYITYTDTNNDSNLDPNDKLLIQGGGKGDEVYVVYKPSGGIIATVTLD